MARRGAKILPADFGLAAIEDAVRETVVDALDDDATLAVFVPTDPAAAPGD